MFLKFLSFIIGISSVISLNISCEFKLEEVFDTFGEQYTCKVDQITNWQEKKSFSLQYSNIHRHLDGMDERNVTAIHFGASDLSYVPEIHETFPNIETIIFRETNLISISRNDLKHFKNLLAFEIHGSKITELPIDLFFENTKLRFLTIRYASELKFLYTNMLLREKLSSLEYVNFYKSGCISEVAMSKTEVDKLNLKLSEICPEIIPPKIDVTTILSEVTTTKPSPTTTKLSSTTTKSSNPSYSNKTTTSRPIIDTFISIAVAMNTTNENSIVDNASDLSLIMSNTYQSTNSSDNVANSLPFKNVTEVDFSKMESDPDYMKNKSIATSTTEPAFASDKVNSKTTILTTETCDQKVKRMKNDIEDMEKKIEFLEKEIENLNKNKKVNKST
jgi:hypothetical protein